MSINITATPVVPAPRDLDAEQQRDVERLEAAVQQYLAGEMVDYELPDDAVAAALADVPVLA